LTTTKEHKEAMRRWYLRNRERILAARRTPEGKQKEREYRKTLKKNPVRQKERNLKKYGLSLEDLQKLLSLQKEVCLICSRVLKITSDNKTERACVDHCHKTGKVRGLLCHKCNAGLGMFEESLDSLQKSIDYLKDRQ
jgi:hypothetical protein